MLFSDSKPGPSAHETNERKRAPDTKRAVQSEPDRGVLHKKRFDDLDKMHVSNRPRSQTLHSPINKLHSEIERLKLDLARSQKTNAELNDRLEKQKKHTAAQDHGIDELKRAALTDKAEIKDLGVKLRLSEHQRSQTVAKQGDMNEVKKALSSLEARRRDEVKERERTISEFEKALAAEKKKRESMDAQLKDVKAKCGTEVAEMKETIKSLKEQVARALDETQNVEERANTAERGFANCDKMLAQVTDLYGVLSKTSVPKVVHEQFQHQYAALQIRNNRVSRQLANSESQVAELVRLVRQGKEQREALRHALRSAEEEISFYSSVARDRQDDPHAVDFSLYDRFANILYEAQSSEKQDKCSILQFTLEQASFFDHEYHDLLWAYSEAEGELKEMTSARDVFEVQTQEARDERDTTKELLLASTQTANTLKASSEILQRQVTELKSKLEKEKVVYEAAVKKEKDIIHRLTATIQKERMAEESLRSEVEELTAELMKAAQFEEAYYSLSEEVESLVARNALAEDEAQKLSQFNAEILGHHNPAQRIMYVERIRNELADTKQKLSSSIRTNEVANTLNQELQQELDMYKSVMVPHENKPKTNMTRVTRPPLTSLNQSST
ncbi:hypothetical protein VKT23_000720 [Stygiomarasmius scandens]|uniref:Uncharacterized protein n=1 Tax=Marasmiellus scandens TaxID=2682957 RepID=A0ABR1K8S8_9AGAR